MTAPPPLADAARAAGCPAEGVRALERAARIVVLEPNLAYAMATYRDLAARAVALAAREPLTPAAYRDATGTSRKYVMAILEDLDRRAILRRTAAGHVPRSSAAPSRAGSVTERVGAVVLAGGRSSRFGRDKLAEPIDGRPLLDHAIAAVRALTDVIVVVRAPDKDPTHLDGVTLVHDERPFEGPLVGLDAGLAALGAEVDRVIVVGEFMPALVPAVLERLLAALGSGTTAAILDADGPRPILPMALVSVPAGVGVRRLVGAESSASAPSSTT